MSEGYAMHAGNVINFPLAPKMLQESKHDLKDFDDLEIVLSDRDVVTLGNALEDLQKTLSLLDRSIEAIRNNDLPTMIRLRDQIISKAHK
jgi:hypothetical protein